MLTDAKIKSLKIEDGKRHYKSLIRDIYPFIGLKKALAPKPRVTSQPAIHPDEAHKMMDIIKNRNKLGRVDNYPPAYVPRLVRGIQEL